MAKAATKQSHFAPLSPRHEDDSLPEPDHKAALTQTRTPASALTPPTSEDMNARAVDDHDNSSDLSDLDDDDDADDDEIKPAYYHGDGRVPVFMPVILLYHLIYRS